MWSSRARTSSSLTAKATRTTSPNTLFSSTQARTQTVSPHSRSRLAEKEDRWSIPVIWAIRSRSCPSGLESTSKLAWRICNCSSVKVVRTRLALPCLPSRITLVTVTFLSLSLSIYLYLCRRYSRWDRWNGFYKGHDCSVARILRRWIVAVCRCYRRNKRDDKRDHVLDAPSHSVECVDHIWNICFQNV